MFKKNFQGLILALLFGILPLSLGAQSIEIETTQTYQTMEGFGAAVAWYNNWLADHPNKAELYDLLFRDLNLDILRLRNTYRYNPSFGASDVEILTGAEATLGRSLTVFMSSWSPPANLKSNGNTEGQGGTLAKENGLFVYGKFADYWYDSLVAYRNLGIDPAYISIQNEPDWTADWENCLFDPAESADRPGYGIALDGVYNRLQNLTEPPGILGPETTGTGSSKIQNYLAEVDLSQLAGINHHLYNGGDPANPDSFNSTFQTLKNLYYPMPLWQTEYDWAAPFETALLIHNSLVEENVSAYLHWDLIWENNTDKPLIGLENPWNEGSWTTQQGYEINDYYYYFKHYSAYIEKNFKRVAANISHQDIRASAFLSPDNNQLTVILINKGNTSLTPTLNPGKFNFSFSEIFTTGGNDQFASKGSLDSSNIITLPAKSVTTVVLTSNTNLLMGDVNNDKIINIIDAMLIARHSAGLNPDGFNIGAGDVDNSGATDIIDALLVARYSAGLISQF